MEKKKFHPNIIDILLIVLIAAVAVAAYFISHRQETDTQQSVSRSYTIEFTNLEEHMLDCIQPGDPVTDNIKNLDMGVVTNVEAIPATAISFSKETGTYHETPIPGKYTLLVTVQAETTQTEKQIATVSGYVLRVGTSVSCTIGTLYSSGYIVIMDR